MKRRQFLQTSGVAALAAFSPLASRTSSALGSQRMLPNHDDRVIIIGAGLAGLTAARRLVDQHGFNQPEQVVVLEASQRVGGRLHSDRTFGDAVADIGATWIHGTINNPVRKLTDHYGMDRWLTHWDSLDIHDRSANLVTKSSARRVSNKVQYSYLKVRNRRRHMTIDQPMSQTLDDVGAPALFKPNEQDIADYYYGEMVEELCQYHQNLSTLSWYTDWAFKGPDELLPDGYDVLPTMMSHGLDIRYGEHVAHIEYHDAGVTVTTSQGIYHADRCIVTLPLGVLKANSVTFTPVLPPQITNAVQSLGFGNRHRVVMEFPSIFWNNTVEFIGSVGSRYGDYGKCDNILFVNREPVMHRPVISAETIADFSYRQEVLGAEGAAAVVMERLRQIYGPSIPDPIQIAGSNWGSDPLFLGSYTAWKVGANKSDNATFSVPVDDRLFFAGEHTSIKYPSTVHGAMFSGVSAALRLHQIAG